MREGPWQLQKEQLCTHLQRKDKRIIKESVSLWSPESCFETHIWADKGEVGNCEQSFLIYERWIMPYQLVRKLLGLMTWGHLSMSFALISAKYNFDCLSQRVLANESYSTWRTVTAGVLLGSTLGLPCLACSKKDLEEVMGWLLIKFTNDIRLRKYQSISSSTWLSSTET